MEVPREELEVERTREHDPDEVALEKHRHHICGSTTHNTHDTRTHTHTRAREGECDAFAAQHNTTCDATRHDGGGGT